MSCKNVVEACKAMKTRRTASHTAFLVITSSPHSVGGTAGASKSLQFRFIYPISPLRSNIRSNQLELFFVEASPALSSNSRGEDVNTEVYRDNILYSTAGTIET